MKIALYYPWIYLKSGAERTILETVKRSKHNYTIFTNRFEPENTYPEFKNLNVVELRGISVKRDMFSVLKAAVIVATQKIHLSGYALFLIHTDGLADLIILRNKSLSVPVVCYCHTPLRPVFDEYYRAHALEDRPRKLYMVFKLLSWIFRLFDRQLWKNYDFVFFNSKETLRRAKKGGLLKTKNYEILHPGVDYKRRNLSKTYNKYFLVPGRIMWTKNIELAIEAFVLLKKHRTKKLKNFKLKIAGQVDKKSERYLNKLKMMVGSRKDIIFRVNLSDNEMTRLYRNCFVVVCTSFNEDFGMTLLEGNSFGKPTIAVNQGGHIESQVNGITGFLVDPTKEAFAEAILKLVRDHNLTKEMGKNARQNSKKYDWKNFIETSDRKIEELVN